jgi:deoxyribodipyrimidine photo-lyase
MKSSTTSPARPRRKSSATKTSPIKSATKPDRASLAANLPEALRQIADTPRVCIRRGGSPAADSKCVVYWMQRAQRGIDNPALDCAIAVANELGLPVVAYFSAISNFPRANWRHYAFLNQGLHDVEQDLAERGVGFVVRRPPDHSLERFAAEVGAAIIIGDENPLRDPERWRSVLAGRLKIPYWTVDADVIVPSCLFERTFFAQHLFRKQLLPLLPEYLVDSTPAKVAKPWSPPNSLDRWILDDDITRGWRHFNRSVKPVDTFAGGSHAAFRRLRYFIDRQLADYEGARRKPQINGTSQLSPYLHFGHISPLRIVLEVKKAVAAGKAPQSAYDAYTNELIGWRELAVNFVRYHNETYDTIECAEPWAQKTLREHVRDSRDPAYTCEQLERGETRDALWNAAQQQMVRYGWMHNILRMYWGKKILEWAPTPAKAYDWAVLLNDTYELDGRDPNSYAGIAWAIAGKFDRPWGEREIFGKIRYMSGASTGRKFDSKRYIALVGEPPKATAELYAAVTQVGY